MHSIAQASFDLLHDDVLICIGEYTGKLFGPETYVCLAQTCKKIKGLLLPDENTSETEELQTIQNIIQLRVTHYSSGHGARPNVTVRTLEELGVFESWYETPLYHDNRIPFPYASVEIDDSMHDKIFSVVKLMERFPSITIHLDSHCGTIAPNGVATLFSISRGNSIMQVIQDRSRVTVIGWGKRVAREVARSDTHPFSELAREGRGWVEVYIEIGVGESAVTLPPRHEYYGYDRNQDVEDDESVE